MVATDLKHCDDVFVARPFVEERVVAACTCSLCAILLQSHLLLLPSPRMNISALNAWLPVAQ